MASSSLARSTFQWKYDVFLSFRGEDTRNCFTDHLYYALNQNGIVTFLDNKLPRGSEISSELLSTIEASRFSIVVFSKNYASSTWCLDELAKIVDRIDNNQHTAFPLFYDIDPSDVRKQTGEFKEAFDKHERQNKEKAKKWRSALTKVANLSGWHLQDSSESQLIQDIVKEISERLDQLFSSVAEGLVGIRPPIKELINNYLEVGLNEVRFVGICGMGGIGKSTIARALYEMLLNQYDAGCFLANVREKYEKKGLEHLQGQILSNILKENNLNICDVRDGINLIRRRLCRKKVLIVLDDVDQSEQLEALCNTHNCFGSGSRIIITTRNQRLLISHGVKKIHIYNVRGLDKNEALELFYSKVTKHGTQTSDHVKYFKQIIDYAQGLPLALEVLGSYLCERNVDEWKCALERLRKYPNQKILMVLRISYDGLEEIEKKIFLDIACFFKGKKQDQVKQILKYCEFYPDSGITDLIEKSLIKILDNRFWMHDMVQEMGFKIVREQHPLEPGKWSRLWQFDDIYRVLKENQGTPAVEGIFHNNPKEEITKLDGKSFSNMRNMRLLKISNIRFSKELEYLSNELRFLKWKGYHLKSLPSSFHPRKLVQLIMYSSRIEYLWKGKKIFNELKTIKLCHSCKLIRTPDFTRVPNLEMLDLEGCKRLAEVHQSVGRLKSLIVLNLKDCKNLVRFLSSVHDLISLKMLILNGCSKLDKLPDDLGEAKSLEELDVSGTAIRQVPSSIVRLTKLQTFSLHGLKEQPDRTRFCSYLQFWIPKRNSQFSMCMLLPSLTGLSSLTKLDLSNCNLSEGALPSDLGSLSSLEILDLSGNNFVSLPESIKQLLQLTILCLKGCQRLKSLPQLPPNLGILSAEACTSLETLPSTLLELCTSREIALHFFNCIKLFQNQGIADMLLKQWLQASLSHGFSNDDFQFSIRLPGSEIPKLFTHWRNDDSICIQLPSGWLNGNFVGFAICGVFALPVGYSAENPKVHARLDVGGYSFEIFFEIPGFTRIESDHLCLGFLSRETIESLVRNLLGKITGRHVRTRFWISGKGEQNWNTSMKKCGIRLVYKQDLEYLGADLSFEKMPLDVGSIVEQDHDLLKSSDIIFLVHMPFELTKWSIWNSGENWAKARRAECKKFSGSATDYDEQNREFVKSVIKKIFEHRAKARKAENKKFSGSTTEDEEQTSEINEDILLGSTIDDEEQTGESNEDILLSDPTRIDEDGTSGSPEAAGFYEKRHDDLRKLEFIEQNTGLKIFAELF